MMIGADTSTDAGRKRSKAAPDARLSPLRGAAVILIVVLAIAILITVDPDLWRPIEFTGLE